MSEKALWLPRRDARNGISIRAKGKKERTVVRVLGWYDETELEGPHLIPLGDFLRGLGITLKDCQAALEPTDA